MMKRLLVLAAALLVLLAAGAMADQAADPLKGKLTWTKVDARRLRPDGLPYLFNDASYYARHETDDMKATVHKLNSMLDKAKDAHPEVTVYTYFIESSRSLNVRGNVSKESSVCAYVRENLCSDRFDRLKVTSLSDLGRWFWSTDHHWSWKGSYQGYLDVFALLGLEGEPAVPTEEKEFPVIFNGSLAKNVKQPISEEKFTVYLFDGVPNYKTTVNGKRKQHDGISTYLKGRYASDIYTDHYSAYYGSNPAEVIYDTGREELPTLLVITNSFGDPVNELLCLHYGRVISVNLKHYKEQLGTSFDLNAYIERYGITQVLILGDFSLYFYP